MYLIEVSEYIKEQIRSSVYLLTTSHKHQALVLQGLPELPSGLAEAVQVFGRNHEVYPLN